MKPNRQHCHPKANDPFAAAERLAETITEALE
jgi:hypothetical protein